MKSLRELFRIGKGPSSSHTMGPAKAAQIYARRHPEAKCFEVTLYGSLAATGKGHLTDIAIINVDAQPRHCVAAFDGEVWHTHDRGRRLCH